LVARASLTPLGGAGMGNGLSAKPGPYDNSNIVYSDENPIGPGYFRTLGIPLIAGREFTQADNEHSPNVVILNETFAHQISPDGGVVGRHVRMGPQAKDTQIVGVVKDSKFGGMRQTPERFMYVPDRQNGIQLTTQCVFFLRTNGNDQGVMAAIPKIVKQFDTTLPVDDIRTMNTLVDNNTYTDRLMAILAIAFGMLATLLAAVGLYGIISYSVARRTQEFGIRLALGAERGNIITLVIREIAWLVVIGLIVGLPVSYALALLVQSQLYGIKAYDPVVLIGATLVLIAAGGLAGWIPAVRAMRIEPTQALRYE
jgi:putative ABC transport system permease protein